MFQILTNNDSINSSTKLAINGSINGSSKLDINGSTMLAIKENKC